MVASALPSTPISINTLILLAYKRAGLLPVEAKLSGANMTPKLEHGRQLLDLIMDGLATSGFIARTTSFYNLTLIANTASYVLPDSILDVYEDASMGSAGLACKQIDLSTWQTLSTATGSTPQLYVAMRHGATVELRLWPTPSEAGVLRLKTVRLLGDNSDGDLTPDLHRYWFDALIWCLAYYVAVDSSMPQGKVDFLAGMAEQKKKQCLQYSFEHTSQQASVSYSTQWGG